MSYKYAVIVPCYKRVENTEKIIRHYSQMRDVLLIVSLQQYSSEFLKRNKKIFNQVNVIADIINESVPLGTLRKKLLKMVHTSEFASVLMHDNDLLIEREDMEIFHNLLHASGYNFITPDLYNKCDENGFGIFRLATACIMIKTMSLNNVVDKLSDIEANEDVELTYLLGNKGIVVSPLHLKSEFKDVTENTVIENKQEKLKESAKFLQNKYGKKVAKLLVRDSGNHFIIFDETINQGELNMKPKILLYDGHDRAGKTSTIKRVWEMRSKIDSCQDRTILSNLVYNEKFNRVPVKPEEYLKLLPKENCHIIMLYCSNITRLKSRFVASNEIVPSVTELDYDLELFKKWYNWLEKKLKKTKIKMHSFDTAQYTKQQIADQINATLEE